MLRLTPLHVRPHPALTIPRVRSARIPPIGHHHPEELRVEVVVHDIHPLLDLGELGGGGGGTVDGAGGEERGGHVEGGFPEVGEFVEDVGDGGGRGAVVEEDDEAVG